MEQFIPWTHCSLYRGWSTGCLEKVCFSVVSCQFVQQGECSYLQALFRKVLKRGTCSSSSMGLTIGSLGEKGDVSHNLWFWNSRSLPERFNRSLPNFHKNLYKKRKGERKGGKERERDRQTDRQTDKVSQTFILLWVASIITRIDAKTFHLPAESLMARQLQQCVSMHCLLGNTGNPVKRLPGTNPDPSHSKKAGHLRGS